MRPNFLVIGAAKCGTTSLYYALGRHPEVFMCEPKEPHFFSRDEVFAKGVGWYESLFARAEGAKAIGEASATYSMRERYPAAAERIIEHLSEVRLIYCVRHPLERIRSAWMYNVGRIDVGLPESFSEAVLHHGPLIDNSLYWKQLNVYRQYIPDDRIAVVFLEDFRQDPDGELNRCFRFLGVEPEVRIEGVSEARNKGMERRRDGTLAAMVRRLPGFERVRDVAPAGLRGSLAARLKRPSAAPRWEPEVRQYAVGRIAEDAERFLAFCGKRRDFWPMEAERGAEGAESRT